MMKISLLTILLITGVFAQELEVEGDLTVTGNIQSQTIDSLLQVIQDLQSQLNALQGGWETRMFDIDFSFESNSEETGMDFLLNDIVNQEIDIGTINVLDFNIMNSDCIQNHDIYLRINSMDVLNGNDIFYMYILNNVIYNKIFNSGVFNTEFNQFLLYATGNETCTMGGTISFLVTAQFPD